MRLTILAIATAASAFAASANAKVVEIAPSSPWNVDFAENKCRLSRVFGEGDARHLVFFEQFWPSQAFGMTAAGPSFTRFASRQRTYLRFYETQEPARTEPFAGTVDTLGAAVIYSTIGIEPAPETDEAEVYALDRLPALDEASAARVAFVGLKQRGDEIRLMTGPLDQAFAVLDRCALDLVGTWGLDIEAHRTATRLLRWTNRDAVARRIVASYPRGALYDGEQGIMRMRVIVSPQGTVEECAIIKATDTRRLDSPACKAMAGAQFEPALDAAGQPMRSFFAESIVYQMQQ